MKTFIFDFNLFIPEKLEIAHIHMETKEEVPFFSRYWLSIVNSIVSRVQSKQDIEEAIVKTVKEYQLYKVEVKFNSTSKPLTVEDLQDLDICYNSTNFIGFCIYGNQ